MPLKDYFSRTGEQNITKFGTKHHLGNGNQFCINKGGGLQGAPPLE